MIPITTCTVTKNNGQLLKYSIESIVNHVSEILIFDDSINEFDRNPYLDCLSKYQNVTIFTNKEFGKDLGKKKQYLVDNSKNDIVMRWDDDFILYNINLLEYIYKELSNSELDTIVTLNPNIAFTFDYLRPIHNYCGEIYLYKKHIIKFGKLYGFSDFPIKRNVNRIDIDRMLFFHLWNFKSYENMYFREYMSQYLCDDNFNSYDIYCFVNEFPNIEYDFNTIIKYKQDNIRKYKQLKYKFNKDVDEFKRVFDLSIFNNDFLQYIHDNYKIKEVFSKNTKLFTYETLETYNLVNLFYNRDGKIENMLSYYLFEKCSGFKHNICDKTERHFLITSCINNNSNNSIIWGSKIKDKSDNITFFKIYCLSGPESKEIIKQHKNIDIEYFGNPILLTSLFYKSQQKINKDIGIVVNKFSYDKYKCLESENVDIISSRDNFNKIIYIEEFVDLLHNYNYVLTNVLDIVCLCNSYDIPVVYFKDISFDTEFMIDDYFHGMYDNKYKPITKYKRENLIKYIKLIKKIYKPPPLKQQRQLDLINSCPFIDTGLKHLLLKMV